jgi:hypothetical protein
MTPHASHASCNLSRDSSRDICESNTFPK